MPMVEIEKPADEPLGTWFETLRGWLDRNGCGSVTFARIGQDGDPPIYRLAFADGAHAAKFSRTFAAYVAPVPEAAADDGTDFVLANAPA